MVKTTTARVGLPPARRGRFEGLGDGAHAAASLVLHGLPPLQLSGDPPPDALQVQDPVKLSRPQGNTRRRKHTRLITHQALNLCWKELMAIGTHLSLPGLSLT